MLLNLKENALGGAFFSSVVNWDLSFSFFKKITLQVFSEQLFNEHCERPPLSVYWTLNEVQTICYVFNIDLENIFIDSLILVQSYQWEY